MSKDLLYKPELGYDKNYYTEGNVSNIINEEERIETEMNDNLVDKVDKIKDIVEDIKSKLPIIPIEILDVYLPSFIIVNDLVNDIDKNKDKIPKDPTVMPPDWSDVEESNPGIVIDKNEPPTNPFAREEDVYINLTPIVISKQDELEKQYTIDLVDILEDYLINYNQNIDKYINNVMVYLSLSMHDTLNLITTKNLKNKNLSHASDYLTKSTIALKQQLSLSKKLFDTDETIFHIRSTKVVNEQRKRYASNIRIEDENRLTKASNDLLKESILVAEKKYEENFYALYKYLNSSVILFNESMNIIIKQKKILTLLNNKEREN